MKKIIRYIMLLLFLIIVSSCEKTEPPLSNTLPPISTTTSIPIVTPSLTASPTVTITPSPTPICSELSPATSEILIELYGNFHTMGVIIIIGDSDPDQDAIALIEYRTGSDSFQQGFPLSRVSETEYIGSLFWLEPGTPYDVRVSFIDEGEQLHCSTVTSSAATRSEITSLDPINSFVVSPNGSGTSCTMDNPCALTRGLELAIPGDAVLLRGGIYYQGDLGLPRSGTEDAPITIQGVPSEQAILDGSDPNSFTWEPRENGIYETTVNVSAPSLVMVDGQRLYRYQNFQDLEDLSWGLPGFLAQGYRIYVHLNDNADLQNYDVRWYRSGLYIRDGSNNLIQNCTFAHNGYGIILQGASHNNLIEGNEFYDTIYDWSWDAVKALHDNTGQGMETGGIKINDPHRTNPQAMPRGTVIRNNRIHDFFDGISICSFENPVIPSNETDVYNNEFFRLGDDGTEADGYCSNVRIFNNTFHDVLVGVSLAPIWDGPTYVIRNLVYNPGKEFGCPFGLEGVCGGTGLKFQYSASGTGQIFLFHNTFDGRTGHYSAFLSEDAQWPLLLSRNNNWGSSHSGGLGIKVDDPVDFDYDNIFAGEDSPLIHWLEDYFNDYDIFQKVTGQEQNGLNEDPQFNDMLSGDYTLSQNSSLIDAGEHIPGINHDYFGLGPDIGAYEYTP